MAEKLPIDEYLENISDLFKQHSSVVLSAAPGAGKTTRVPAFLAKKSFGKILVLEPRRMAAVAAAYRIAEEQSWKLGEQIGYQVRFENKTKPETKLIFMTEALLARQMLSDPELKNVEMVILDEFHERSASVDLTLALIKELQIMGSDIKLLVMSATLQSQEISTYLRQAPVVEVPGKLFPLQVSQQKESQRLRLDNVFFDNLKEKIKKSLSRTSNDILVFLPGVGEIRQMQKRLEEQSWPRDCDVLALHGRLPLEEQRKVLIRGSTQRIILSTNVAESSVTVDGVDTVIDCGLEKMATWDQRTDFSRLEVQRVSLSSARQRAGRAARQKDGYCDQMWSPQDELSMPKDRPAEIQRIDLSEILLFLAHHGIHDFEKFDWFQKPDSLRLRFSVQKLIHLQILDSSHKLTALGKKIIHWPLSPDLAVLLDHFNELQQPELGAQIVSCLQENDFLNIKSEEHPEGLNLESDLNFRLQVLNGVSRLDRGEIHYSSFERVKESVKSLLHHFHRDIPKSSAKKSMTSDEIRKEILKCWPHRLCRRREKTARGLSINGYGVQISNQSFVKTSEYFLALSGVDGTSATETLITMAIGYSKEEVIEILGDRIELHEELSFNDERQEVLLSVQRRLGAFALEEAQFKKPSLEQTQELLPQLALQRWSSWIKENEAFANYYQRVLFLIHHRLLLPEEIQKDLEDFSLETWKELSLKDASFGETFFQSLITKDLLYFFDSHLPASLKKVLEKEIPKSLLLPSGKTHSINYEKPESPTLEIRLQEVFGWPQTPKVLFGKVQLTLSLLAPNYRPVQITQDLGSFWKNGYNEVKKELRSRYPKHSWPDDPLQAAAIAGPRRRPK